MNKLRNTVAATALAAGSLLANAAPAMSQETTHGHRVTEGQDGHPDTWETGETVPTETTDTTDFTGDRVTPQPDGTNTWETGEHADEPTPPVETTATTVLHGDRVTPQPDGTNTWETGTHVEDTAPVATPTPVAEAPQPPVSTELPTTSTTEAPIETEAVSASGNETDDRGLTIPAGVAVGLGVTAVAAGLVKRNRDNH